MSADDAIMPDNIYKGVLPKGAGVIPLAIKNGELLFLFKKTFSGRKTGYLVTTNDKNRVKTMRKGKRSFRHESLQNSSSISNILQSITKAIEKGKVVFSDEDDRIVMEPEGLLQLKVTASQEDSRQRINVRISWQVEEASNKKKRVLSVE